MTNPTSVTYAERDDFTVQMLKEICDSAADTEYVLELVNAALAKAQDASHPPKSSEPKNINQCHTRTLKAWDAFMVLYVHRDILFLDDPRKNIPLHYYFSPSQCEFAFRRIDAVMTTAEVLYITWKGARDIVMPTLSACIEHILLQEKAT